MTYHTNPSEPDPSELRHLTRREVLARGTAGVGAFTLMGGALAACGASSQATSTPASGPPKRGGTLRLGLTGGGSTDTVDANTEIFTPDYARVQQLYNTLNFYDPPNLAIVNSLAESIEPSPDAKQWTIRLHRGIEFHNGKELTATDVVYTFHRIITHKLPGLAGFTPVIPSSIRALDKYTVRLSTAYPFSSLPDQLACPVYFSIVPAGYQPSHAIGTGPFKLVSFTPTSQTILERNPNYWKTGLPYLDRIVITEFNDNSALTNALLADQIDLACNIPVDSLAGVQNQPGLTTRIDQSGAWVAMTMRVDRPPFTDARVRQAFRLIANRQQMVDAALAGHGVLGNDVYSIYDPLYDHSLPQRVQDIEQARSLLKQAGQDNLNLTLITNPTYIGMVENAIVFKSNAAQAGVNVNVLTVDAGKFYSNYYGKSTLSMDWWQWLDYVSQTAFAHLPGAFFNVTHWSDPKYVALYKEANSLLDEQKKKAVIQEMMRIDYDQGSLIIPWFAGISTTYSHRVHGITPSKNGFGASGMYLEKIWMD